MSENSGEYSGTDKSSGGIVKKLVLTAGAVTALIVAQKAASGVLKAPGNEISSGVQTPPHLVEAIEHPKSNQVEYLPGKVTIDPEAELRTTPANQFIDGDGLIEPLTDNLVHKENLISLNSNNNIDFSKPFTISDAQVTKGQAPAFREHTWIAMQGTFKDGSTSLVFVSVSDMTSNVVHPPTNPYGEILDYANLPTVKAPLSKVGTLGIGKITQGDS